MKELVRRLFAERYGRDASLLVRAPGRVNLIGEHTDYNGGFVFPMAIERAVWIAAEPSDSPSVEIYSHTFDSAASFSLPDFKREGTDWIEYVKGTADSLRKAGVPLRGWRGVIASDVPAGAGLSSSAALEMAIGRVFSAIADVDVPPAQLALIGQQAENQWVGMNCGIMDQLASAAGRADHALLIDCRDIRVTPVPLPTDCHVIIMDTATRRELQHSAYNSRRAQCEEGARFFGAELLRSVRSTDLPRAIGKLPAQVLRRTRHVVMENERTEEAAEVLRAGDAAAFGALMNASHESLRFDFEVSSPMLDLMVDIARKQAGCYGARMTGAGFGGCAVALVRSGDVEQFLARVTKEYNDRSGHESMLFASRATPGAAVLEGSC
jgi:galactokinase